MIEFVSYQTASVSTRVQTEGKVASNLFESAGDVRATSTKSGTLVLE